MPVIAEHITQPSEQDRLDLGKTYEGDTAWLEQVLKGPDCLVGGRFNDRLVAAFVLRDAGEHWQLERLRVREITRRRGVARQTLHSALGTLGLQKPVKVDLSQHPELQPLFRELGFEGDGELQWRP